MITWLITYMAHSTGLLHTHQYTVDSDMSFDTIIKQIPDVRCIVTITQWFPPVFGVGSTIPNQTEKK